MSPSWNALAALAQQASAQPLRLETVLLPLTAALGLALIVERVVEVMKNVVDMLPTTSVGRAIQKPTLAAMASQGLKQLHEDDEKLAKADAERATLVDRLVVTEETLRVTPESDTETRQSLEREREKLREVLGADEGNTEWREVHPLETILVEPATDPDDGNTLRAFVLQAVAVIVGIIAARVTHLQLFHVLAPNAGLSVPVDYLLTGLFVGGGSAPAHVLIRFISERRIVVPEAASRAEVPVAAAAVAVAEARTGIGTPASAAIAAVAHAGSPAFDPDRWLDIPYAGGVDRERLESIHRRGADPNLVVFHHTAMPLKSTFEDVVRVIKSRKDSTGKPWVTGYNCVVLADGSINPFCRWDRYGNHAQGYNRLSLGITLNGNFETDPRQPFSNPDGRYGPSRPTEQQLDAAARVVALWTHLYPAIPLAFDRRKEGIIPHRNVSPKTCPGNMFPYPQFEKLVRHYHDTWQRSSECRSRIAAFKLRQFLYADPANIPAMKPLPAAQVIPVHSPQPTATSPGASGPTAITS